MSYRPFILLILGVAFVIAGCGNVQGSKGWFRDKAKDYHDATFTTPIEVPDTFQLQAKPEDFPLPKNIPAEKKAYNVSIVPPTAPELTKR